jgi:hypothetical protein
MRLSGLVIAAILFVSTTLLAQHSSGGGGGSSSGGSSGGGYSGGSSHGGSGGGYSGSSSSHVSSGGGSGSSHGSSSSSSAKSTGSSAVRSSNDSAKAKSGVNPDKRSFASFLRHPFRKPQPVQNAEFKRPAPCLKGPCPVCPSGQFRSGNSCVVATNACAPGQSWNGFACGVPYRFNDCSALANQLEAERRRMQGQSDPGQAVFYRMLQQQYESCLQRYGSSAFEGLLSDSLFNAP